MIRCAIMAYRAITDPPRQDASQCPAATPARLDGIPEHELTGCAMEPTAEGLIDVTAWPEVTGAGRSPGRDRLAAALRALQEAGDGTTAPDPVARRAAPSL